MEEFENSPEGYGFDLRLDLADIILDQLAKKKMTQKSLAEKAGMKPSYLARILHGSQNFTSDVAGRIFYALGIKGKLVEAKDEKEESNGFKIAKESSRAGSFRICTAGAASNDIYRQIAKA
jgi:transcriptional regulator with XRE-family HTH domain